MTSDPAQTYVWIWLPATTMPVVAGVVTPSDRDRSVLLFTYARSYRDNPAAIPLFTPELPLAAGTFTPTRPGRLPDGSENKAWPGLPHPSQRFPLSVHGCLRDAAPDAWGRRVINLRIAGDPEAELGELTYWMQSTSDRIGALDFQPSAKEYAPRGAPASLDELFEVATRIQQGLPVPDELAAAAGHGTSIGGARPKALLEDRGRHLIAKFPSSDDSRPVVQAEAVAMTLAAQAGASVAPVEVVRVSGRPVLLVDRFDRPPGGGRRMMVSALTILGADSSGARYLSYADLAESMVAPGWADGVSDVRELFRRLVINIAVGNTDDHMRNHAAFFDGSALSLTPAYDVAPQIRSTAMASHAVGMGRGGSRLSRFGNAIAAAKWFRISESEARDVVTHVIGVVRTGFPDACDRALLTRAEAATLWEREFLNPYAFYDED